MNQDEMNNELWDWLYLFHPQLVSKFLEFYTYKQGLEKSRKLALKGKLK